MRVVVTPGFTRQIKRLHANQKRDLDEAVRQLMQEPFSGEQKAGDLAWLRVYKFRMVNQLALLGYEPDIAAGTLTLHAIGSHENFYRDTKLTGK